MDETLFPLESESGEGRRTEEMRPPVRLVHADRKQILMRPCDLDSLLGEDHRARVVWEFISKLDLAGFHEQVRSREGGAGRPAFDPAVLLTLWVYATLEAVGSARALARLCEEHDAYRWICGGLTINHHTLSDFRSQRAKEIDDLLTRVVATLLAAGAVTMERVAQDGVKVRASAGAPSFRRRETLKRCLEQAREQVQALRQEIESTPEASEERRRAARRRAAEEREKRVEQAYRQWEDVAARSKTPERDKPEKVRVSTTDPDARVMKMADGGFRPAMNGQFATDTKSQVIVGVTLSNSGGDMAQMSPMLQDLQRRYGSLPGEYLVDGGFAKHEAIEEAEGRGVRVFAPVPELGKSSGRREGDGPGVRAWRARMETEQAKAIDQERPGAAECVNAIARNRGLQRFLVRGIGKCLGVLTLFALAHNVMRAVALMAG